MKRSASRSFEFKSQIKYRELLRVLMVFHAASDEHARILWQFNSRDELLEFISFLFLVLIFVISISIIVLAL